MWLSRGLVVAAVLLVQHAAVHGACHTASDCNNEGNCVDSKCICNSGFLPPNCAPFCTNASSCSHHGHCINLRCNCSTGYRGPRCATAGCNITCAHGGKPDTPNASCTRCSRCSLGWGGVGCATWNASALPHLVAEIHRIGTSQYCARRLLSASARTRT